MYLSLSTEAACLGDAVHPVEAGLGGHQQEVVASADEVVPSHLDICMGRGGCHKKVSTEFRGNFRIIHFSLVYILSYCFI